MEQPQDKDSPCCEGCEACREHRHDSSAPVPGALAGWRLAAAATGAFLLPLGLALAGSILAGNSPERRLIGALAGLAAGVAVAWTASRIVSKRIQGSTTEHDQHGD
jgi:hypothetical protein